MLPEDVQEVVRPHLDGAIEQYERLGGGCIANAGRLDTASEILFLKWSRDDVAHTFPPEAEGLRALRKAEAPLFIPEVVAVQNRSGDQPGFLLTDWIATGPEPSGFWEAFGRALASMHRHAADRYGLGTDNFIGRLPQQNSWMDDWPAFFRERRLAPQVEMARERGRWQPEWDGSLENLYRRLDELLPAAPEASVLHGDLWNGNFMVTDGEQPALFDPAAYYGHREADLAMTRLFGGFDQRFYDAYREAWPLEPGFDKRMEVYNLYHLINHLNHFGSSYAGRVGRILKRYGS